MARILHLDASPRGERSVSRQLSREFVEGWIRLHPDDSVIYRDVGHQPPPQVTEAWVVGAYAPPDRHTDAARAAMIASDELIDEFLAADRCVFGVPMHNFSVPSTFKAYVDQIVRIGRTFDSDWKGLVANKPMAVILASGGDYGPGSPAAPFDHQTPWIRTIFGFIGITGIEFIHAYGMNLGDPVRQSGLRYARERIADLLERW